MIARLDHRMVLLAGSVLATALCILLVALVFALRPAETTGDQEVSPPIHAMSAEGSGGSTITQDPSIERHAEVVQRLGGAAFAR